MKVLLTDDVVGLGDIGETVSVRPGFARNYLIPRGLAVESTTASARVIAHKMTQIEAKKKRLKTVAEDRAKSLSEITVRMALRVASGGKVFGSIHAREIAEAITQAGFEVDRRRVLLADPIRKIGAHTVNVKLHADVEVPVQILVEAAAATKEEEDKEAEEAKGRIEERSSEKAAKAESPAAEA